MSRASHKGRLKLKSLSKDADTMVCHLDPPEGGIFGDKWVSADNEEEEDKENKEEKEEEQENIEE